LLLLYYKIKDIAQAAPKRLSLSLTYSRFSTLLILGVYASLRLLAA
jgi:hypothetical protein